jgi:uncharacterized protein YdeI (BOF family)
MRRLITLLLAVTLIGLLSSPATAQLFKDDFTGAVGDTLNGHGYTVQPTPSYLNSIKIVSPGLTYGLYPGSGIGNAVGLKNSGQDIYASFPADSVGSLYAAFMVNLSAAQVGDYFFAFSPTTSTTSYTLRLFAKADTVGGFNLGVTKSNESPAKYGTTHFSFNTTYLVVVKYTFVAADSNDLCSVYAFADPELPETEPGTAEIQDYNGSVRADAPNLAYFTLRQGSSANAPTLTFDGIRIDASWAGALGIGATALITPKALDFGNVVPGGEKTDSVLVKNMGTLLLDVSGFSSTDPVFTVTPSTASLAPRDSAWFHVTFAPSVAGAHTANITFHTNGKYGSDSVVTVSGNAVNPGFSVTPASLNFGSVWTDTPKTDTLTVTNGDASAALVIDSVVSTNDNFSVTPTSGSVDTLQSTKFEVTFHPSVAGVDSGLVIFYHSAATHQDTVAVKGTGAVKVAALVLEKHLSSFGRVLVGQAKTDSVKIKNTGQLALTISDVASKDTSQFGVVLGNATVPAGESTYVKVTFHPTSIGTKADTIVFSSNAPEGMDTLYVNGLGAEPAAMFAVTPKAVAFGSLRVGEQKSDTLKIKNAGELTLQISGVAQMDTTFHLMLGADSVKAGDSTWLVVRFAPAVVGTYRDTVVFTSNAVEVTDTLTLSGTANDVISIAAARALANGSEVIIRGIVTRAMGSYTFMQDTSGGMIMYSNVAGAPAHDSVASGYIKPGDLLEIHGLTSEYRSLKEIATSGIIGFQRISRGNPVPEPQVVTLAEVAANGEKYEAELIKIKKLRFTSASGTFLNALSYAIADSSDTTGAVVLRVQGATDTQLGGLPIPIGTFTFIGPLGQFSSTPTGGYQLLPVDSTDVLPDPLVGIAGMPTGVPTVFELAQNFPNPFNPTTTIQYALPVESRVTVTIYSVLGQEVRTLVNETQKASYYRVEWDGKNGLGAPVATGIYFYRINAEPSAKGGAPFVQVKKMLMLK